MNTTQPAIADTQYWTVGLNDKWSKEPTTINQAESYGFLVKPSRAHGAYQMFMRGQMVGWMFGSQQEQMSFLRQKGLI
jgi:hypothetical protein